MTVHNKKRFGVALIALVGLAVFVCAIKRPSLTQPFASATTNNNQVISPQSTKQQGVLKQTKQLTKKDTLRTVINQPVITHPRNLTAYLSTKQSGIIGIYNGNVLDNPADNIFTVNLDHQPSTNDRIWLSYKLSGLDDQSNVTCSVNDRLAFGGYLLKVNSDTTRQRVQISSSWLKKGFNRFQFSTPENPGYGYQISDLVIEVERGAKSNPLAVNAGKTSYDGKAYIHGFVQDSHSKAAEVSVDGHPIALRDDEYEAIVDLKGKQTIDVVAQIDGKEYRRTVSYNHQAKPDKTFALNSKVEKNTKTFSVGNADSLQTADAQLKVDAKALISTTKLSLTSLRGIDIPAMDMALTNVTDGHQGFRFLPHGEHFTDGATVSLKYDRTKIPDGYTENDIKTFYFDSNTNHWVALERDTINKDLCMVVSKTTHFTDMINGVIKAPESPETQGFAPTMMNDIKAADPASKIGMIAPPTANNSGSANLSYNLEMPPTRNNILPGLAIQYNSDGGSGWLGEGWDLSVPSITVDTRWGVPRYDNTYETETYNMGGVMLATAIKEDGSAEELLTVSIAHRKYKYSRIVDRQFHPRIESGFSQIIRKGDSPNNYYWEVKDKNGITYIYGGTDDSKLKGVITDVNNNKRQVVAEWKLSKVINLYQDEVKFFYDTIPELVSNGLYAKTSYLSRIEVSGPNGKYAQIELNSYSVKSKKINNARYGFLVSNNKLLDKVSVKYLNINMFNINNSNRLVDEVLRSYRFKYIQGAFNTTLLDSVVLQDSIGKDIAAHVLDYYDNVKDAGNSIFSNIKNECVLSTNILSPVLGGSETKTDGASLYLGLGVNDGKFFSTSNTIGYNISGSESTTERTTALIDINGDGLPDIINKKGNKLFFKPNLGNMIFGDEIQMINAPESFSFTKSKSTSEGWKGNVSVFDGGLDDNTTYSDTKVYFSDVNSDGLVDIVSHGVVWFNKLTDINGQAVPSFTTHSNETLNPISDLKTREVNSVIPPYEKPIAREDSMILKEYNRILGNSPMQDLVRVWEAPYEGYIDITSNVQYILPSNGYDVDKYNNADGVYVTVETNGGYILGNLDVSDKRIFVPKNNSIIPVNTTNIHVQKGQKIFFRLKCGNKKDSNGDFDKILWSPVVKYHDDIISDFSTNENGYFVRSYDSKHTLVNKIGYNLIDSGVTNIHVKFNIELLDNIYVNSDFPTDIVHLKVYLENDSLLLKDSIECFHDDSLEIDTWEQYQWTEHNGNYKDTLVYSTELFEFANDMNYTIDDSIDNNFGGRYLRIVLSSESNVCWDRIICTPEVSYTKLNEIDTTFIAGVRIDHFKEIGPDGVKFTPIPPNNKYIIVSPQIGFKEPYNDNGNNLYSGFVKMVIKGSRYYAYPSPGVWKTEIIGKTNLQFNNGQIGWWIPPKINTGYNQSSYTNYGVVQYYRSNINNTTGCFAFQNNYYSNIFVEYYFEEDPEDPHLIEKLSATQPSVDIYGFNDNVKPINDATQTFQGFVDSTKYKVNLYRKMRYTDFDFGSMWRGWGQFEYNASGTLWNAPLDVSLMHQPESVDDIGVEKMAFISMHPDIKAKQSWAGLNDYIYINKDTMSTGRLNIQEMVALNTATGPVLRSASTSAAIEQDTVKDDISNAPILSTTSTSRSIWGGAGTNLGVFNLSASTSSASGGGFTTMGYKDMNGDGFPDRITDSKIEFTNSRGGRDGEKTDIVPERTENNASSTGLNAGRSTSSSPNFSNAAVKILNNSKLSTDASTGELSISVSAAINKNVDNTTNMYCDINGDGLPDRIFKGADNLIKCYLNLGYGFSDIQKPITLNIDKIQSGKSQVGVGVSIGGGIKGLGASVQTGTSTSLTLNTLMDINGDGLADAIYGIGETFGSENIFVKLNLGNAFSEPIEWPVINEIQKQTSITVSENVNATLGYCPLFLKVVASAGYNHSNTTGYTLADIMDINGDGYPDLLNSAIIGATANIHQSIIGCTNKLKTVNNPLGGRFSMEYFHSKATVDHPNGKWVFSAVKMDDGINNDGAIIKTEFEYSGGKYDRHERDFLGFAKVVTKNIDTDQGANNLYRSFTQVFDTSSYYVKGNQLYSLLSDQNGNKYQSDSCDYYQYSVTKNKGGYYSILPIQPTDQSIVYSPQKYTKKELFEGTDNGIITSETFSEYHIDNGKHGELKSYKYSDKGTLKSSGYLDYNYLTEIDYTSTSNIADSYVYGLPKKITVKGSDGKLYRHVEAIWNTAYSNNLMWYYQFLSNGDTAVTQTEYNSKGAINWKLLPKNLNGQRMKYDYSYDAPISMYVTKVTDAFGNTNNFGYDYRFGIQNKVIDANNNVQNTVLDNLGRIKYVQGPNEYAQGRPYTISFDYSPVPTKGVNGISAPAYAVTKHFDPTNPLDDLKTITFSDGFGRPIQVKKESVVRNSPMILISGKAHYDAFGRVDKAYEPDSEAIGQEHVYNISNTVLPFTKTVYDILDRPLSVTPPDGLTTTMNYSIVDTLLKTTVTDPKNNAQATFVNGSGLTVKNEQYSGPDGLITTLFGYDNINQLRSVTDTKGGITLSEYDMAGHRTKVTHPASGITTFKYDPSGNIIHKITANNDIIKYNYDYNRLIGIEYPRHKENDVTYVYGTHSESDLSPFNRAGRLVCQIDGSGAQEFKYGRMGEITEVRRTLVIPNHGVASFKTSWTYDSWNRLQTMTYPDGEKLTYWYNSGGQLNKLTGNKGSETETVYVSDIQYDKFEQRSKVIFGNGTETNYTYNPKMRNLTNLVVKKANSTLMNNSYTYDSVYNITEINSTSNWPTSGTNYQMKHHYGYDNLYRLTSATGIFTGISGNSKSANYTLVMGYDNLHNITHKKQEVDKTNIQFTGLLKAGYDLNYAYDGNPQQISSITDSSYRTADVVTKIGKTQNYSYDANGNLLFVNTVQNDSKGASIVKNQRRLLWDEENRLLAVSDNGFVSNYWYDAAGERTVKSSGDGEGVIINGLLSGGNTGTTNYTAYVSPYTVVSNGGQISEHFYIGSQRVVSKIINTGNFVVSPLTDTLKAKYSSGTVPYDSKYIDLTSKVKVRFDSLGVLYKGLDHKIDGTFLASTTPSTANLKYFYHPDHLGSSSLITDADGNLTQHIEYVPFGEVFLEEHNTWNTPYKFNAKELDEETGLYYYGARYYDPRISVWLSVDPLAEKYPGVSSYVYCMNNPIKFIDPDGKEVLNGVSKLDPKDIRFRKAVTITKNRQDPQTIHLYAHGSPDFIRVVTSNKEEKSEKNNFISTPEELKHFLDVNSDVWKSRKGNSEVTLVLHSCDTGSESQIDQVSFAEEMSKSPEMKNVTIIAPTNPIGVNPDGSGEEVLDSPDGGEGHWVGFKNGEKVLIKPADFQPGTKD